MGLIQVASHTSGTLLCAFLLSCSQRDPGPEDRRYEVKPYGSLKCDTPDDTRVQTLILDLYALKIDSESEAPVLRKAEAINRELSEIGRKNELQSHVDVEARGISEGILKWLSSTEEPRFSEIYMLELLALIQAHLAPFTAERDGKRLQFLFQKAFAAKASFASIDLRWMYRTLVGEFLQDVLDPGWGQREKEPPWPTADDPANEEKMDVYLE